MLEMLGLQSCADMQIGTPIKRGLSGGQKRRVSIGCSLITYPYVHDRKESSYAEADNCGSVASSSSMNLRLV